MDALEPTMWSKTPLEVLCTVVKNCDRQALISWSCTSEFFYDFASNLLWETLRIDTRNATFFEDHAYSLLSTKEVHREDQLIFHFLANNAFRQRPTRQTCGFPLINDQIAKLPSSRVKDLIFDFKRFNPLVRPVAHGRRVAEFVQSILRLMPALQSCYFDGIISTGIWNGFMEARNLRRVDIQRPVERTCRQIPDMQQLANLVHLEILSIGYVTPGEAQGLAQAIVSLRLSELSVWAHPPALDAADIQLESAAVHRRSPLVILLQTLSLYAGDLSATPISRTLKKLKLKDPYRFWNQGWELNDGLLVDTLQHLQNLTHLNICIMHPNTLERFFLQAELSSLESFAISGCRHFLGDDDWAHLGIYIPEIERAPTERNLSFEAFLGRHSKTLSSVAIYQPHFSFTSYQMTMLSFDRVRLDRFWKSKSGLTLEPAMIINGQSWRAGQWTVCGGEENCHILKTKRLPLRNHLRLAFTRS
ncbi:MAG: hypothetical protein Q9178_007357 [Gyalolechia marmorata]